MFDLYPAIDLRAGRTVRLYQGDYNREHAYGTDPVEVARGFAEAGTRWIHVVDLDAARTGEATNRPVIMDIAGAIAVPVQTGGGVRSVEAARALFD
ncbi:MAG: HisA/HisF-related TIM barrel protein, partial [Acidimicrobiales bacterium]